MSFGLPAFAVSFHHPPAGATDTATAGGVSLQPDEAEAEALRGIERDLVSPLHGALVHVVESVALLVESDLVAGRAYAVVGDRPCAYVGTSGLDLAAHQRRRLQAWPMMQSSLFHRLAGVGVVDRPLTVGELFLPGDRHDGDAQGPGVAPMLHPACRLSDGFVITLPIEQHCWAALLLLRHRQRPRFEAVQRDVLMSRRPMLRNVLRRGLAAEQPPTPDPAARHARLSRTERQVLALLCQDKTEREVAEQLDRSPHTVHVHVKSIYRKLGVRSRRQLRRVAQSIPDLT